MAKALHDLLGASRLIEVAEIGEDPRAAGWETFVTYEEQLLSFTDCTSFALMRQRQLLEAFTFDGRLRRATSADRLNPQSVTLVQPRVVARPHETEWATMTPDRLKVRRFGSAGDLGGPPMRYCPRPLRFASTLALTLWFVGCPAAPETTPDAVPAPIPTVAEAAPLGMDRARLFQYITTGNPDGTQPVGQLPPQPFYESWPLFPGPANNPKEFLNKRLGLAVHGRWVTVYVNPVAAQHIESYLNEVETVPVGGTPVVPPTEFPAGSVIVKINFANDPQATTVQQAADPGVLTVSYKPAETGFCQSGVQYNTVDCLGGDWLWAFYGLGKAKALDSFIAESAGSFCINCHTPAFKADYLRGLLRRARTIAFDRVPTAEPAPPPTLAANDPFCQEPIALSSQLPSDVALDPAKITDPAQRQRLFDCFAWRTFVSLNWPASDQRGVPESSAPFGQPKGNRTWETYAQTYEVFQPLDADWVPSEEIWRNPRRLPSVCSKVAPGEPVISMNSKSQSNFADLVNETGQAFAGTFGTLTDRNGHLVHYQVLFNQTEFDYFLADGKAATANLTPVGPASGPESFLPEGSIETKPAWKQLCLESSCEQQDIESDYYTRKVWIYDAVGPTCKPMTVGLVGLHITAKTFWAPQWVWATFEHQNNVPTATLVADGSRRLPLLRWKLPAATGHLFQTAFPRRPAGRRRPLLPEPGDQPDPRQARFRQGLQQPDDPPRQGRRLRAQRALPARHERSGITPSQFDPGQHAVADERPAAGLRPIDNHDARRQYPQL